MFNAETFERHKKFCKANTLRLHQCSKRCYMTKILASEITEYLFGRTTCPCGYIDDSVLPIRSLLKEDKHGKTCKVY